MSILLIRTIAGLREHLAAIRGNQTLGLVPTMGALHAGHGRLIDRSVAECDRVVVTVFVNPLQFGPTEDYAGYPSSLQADLSFCQARGVAALFAPDAPEMYPLPQQTFVEVTGIGDHLCGRFRPGHFRGVATVVLKLFNMVQPDRAYFGEKDAQQLALIRRMVADLNLPITIVAVPTVRDKDGLAFSSRNQTLNQEERRAATVLYRALQAARDRVTGGSIDPVEVQRAALATLQQEPQVRVQYVEVVDPDQMQPVKQITGPVRVAAAVWAGPTRLIDNLLCHYVHPEPKPSGSGSHMPP